MSTFLRIVLCSTISLAVASGAALAEEKEKRLGACKADREKFCADVPHGQHKTRPCLEANKDKLSPECKAALEAPRTEKSEK